MQAVRLAAVDRDPIGIELRCCIRRASSPVRRIHGDKGYRGHHYPDRFKVWTSGQVRRVTKAIRRESLVATIRSPFPREADRTFRRARHPGQTVKVWGGEFRCFEHGGQPCTDPVNRSAQLPPRSLWHKTNSSILRNHLLGL